MNGQGDKKMNKASLLILLGSALVAYGLSGWHATMRMDSLPYLDPTVYSLGGQAGWTPTNQLEITVGAVLLAGGVLMRLKTGKGHS